MRAWAEVNLDNIAFNIREVRRITDRRAKVLVTVKANAYGHGAVQVAKTVLENGAEYLSVATLDEAKELRQSGITAPILILGAVAEDEIAQTAAMDVSPTVFDFATAQRFSEAAQKAGREVKLHIKLDTGMSRIGFLTDTQAARDAAVSEILKIAALPNLFIEGIFTHFSKADEPDRSYTDMQYQRFCAVCDALSMAGLSIPIRHVCNSAGIIDYPEYHLDMVRCGIILYGCYPSETVSRDKITLKPTISFQTTVVHLADRLPGTAVGYGGTWTVDKMRKIATIAIGYADGYSRILSNRAEVLVCGRKAKQVGNICMDQCMVDVTEIPEVKIGDSVILFGSAGNNTITVESVAKLLGTISYEVLCVIGKRVPRIYIQNGNRYLPAEIGINCI